jgi:two-component system, sensor histidine kinase and response regulator
VPAVALFSCEKALTGANEWLIRIEEPRKILSMNPPLQRVQPSEEQTPYFIKYRYGAALWSGLVLVAGLALSAFGVHQAVSDAHTAEQLVFQKDIYQIEEALKDQFDRSLFWTAGVRAMLEVDDNFDRTELQEFVRKSNLATHLPGVYSVGFVQRVMAQDLDAFVASERSAGAADFEVKTSGASADLYVERYTSLLTPSKATYGQDLGANGVEREAIEKAVATGEAALSSLTTLGQSGSTQQGLRYFSPIYKKGTNPSTLAERRAALRGVLDVSIDPQVLLALHPSRVGSVFNFSVFEGQSTVPGKLIYTHNKASTPAVEKAHASPSSRTLVIAGRPLTLLVDMPSMQGTSTSDVLPLSIGLGGGSTSLLLTSILWMLLISRGRAEARASGMTVELDKLAMVVKHTSNAVIITDAQRNITWTNEAFTRVTGYTLEEAQGRSPGTLLQSELTNPITVEQLRTHLNAGKAFQTELQNRSKDGQDYWVNLEIQPMHDAKNRLTGFMAIESDVTRQKLASEKLNAALRTTDALMRTLHLHTIVSEADTEGLITDANALFCQISGYSREELIGQNHSILNSGAQSDAFWRDMWSTISTGKPWRGQVCNRAKNGSLYWVDSLIAPFTDKHGKINKYVSIRTDITDTKVAQVELATERKRLQNILQGTDVGTWEWNVPNGEVRFNERWAFITGHVLAELEPISIQTWTDLTHPDDLIISKELLKQHFAGEADYYECEMRMRHADGHWVWVLNRGKFSSKGADWRIEWMAGIIMDITTRKQAEVAVHASKAFLDRVGKIAGVGGWEYDLITGSITWTEQTRRIHEVDAGYVPDLVSAIDFYAPEARPTLKQSIDNAVLTGRHWDLELPFVTHTGRSIWVRTVGQPEYEGGKPVRLVGAFQDVTERKALAEDIQTQNAMMQAILATIPLGLSVFDGDLNLVLDNALFRTLLALPSDLFKGNNTTFESIIQYSAQRGEYGPGNVEEIVSAIVKRASRPQLHQFERQRPDGTSLEIRGAPMPSGGFVTTYTDISPRKLAEAALKKTTGTLESILNSATDVAVIATGIDGVVTLFNKGAEHLLGYAARDVIGSQTPALWHDAQALTERAQTISTEIGRTITGDRLLMDQSLVGKTNEWAWVRKDGHHIAVSEIVNLIIDSDLEHRGYLFIGHDITAQKAHENSLREAMHKAEMASQAKGQFLANMSHEIRTPMNAILGMLTLLQNTALTTRQLDYATKTEGAAKSLLGLLNDILDFSKVEAGKMTLDPQPFRIDRLMRDLSVILSAYVGKKDVEVLFDIDPVVPRWLIGDSSRLQQILINLGGNAIKFTSSGEVVVAVTVAEQTEHMVGLTFSVRDSGIGISPENQKHIFDGFSQAEASTTRRFGGTGLGLSICKRLVELMGGAMTIDSVLEQGSTFHFTLRLPIDRTQTDVMEDKKQVNVEPLRALVVDDNAVARELMTSMMGSLGWKVDTAASGEEAVALVDKQIQEGIASYQAIFVDWQMPGMDGWETSLKLRTQIGGKSAPIVVMVTAHGREMLTQRTPEEHALLNGFLVKPVTASMILDAIVDARAAMVYPQHGKTVLRTQTKRLQGMRLLVVEDNAINQQIAQELLTAEGASVQLASNGQLGVEAVLAAAPLFDAVLMDIQMPVMDGYTATRALRRALGSTPLPIIAMTANAMTSDQEACRDAGMNDHVGKPFDLSHLVATLIRHVGRSSIPLQITAAVTEVVPQIPEEPEIADNPVKAVHLGIDVEGAIKRMGCDEEFYLEIVQMFLNDTEPMPEQLKRHLLANEHVAAARLLHTLKGVAATVGAGALAELAAQVEDKLKADPAGTSAESLVSDIQQGINSACILLKQVMHKLDKSETGSQDATVPDVVKLSSSDIAATLLKLDRLLRDSDMQATTVHSNLSRDRDSALDDAFGQLDRAMSALDFSTARRHCMSLISHFNPAV